VKKSGFNLRDRKFRTVFWGADRREVHAALDAVATEYERLQAELRQISEEREALAREIERIIELDRSVVRVLVGAEEEAGIKRAAARRHGAALIAQAEEQAAGLLRDSERERDGLQQDLAAYVERRQHAVRTLHALIGQMGTGEDVSTSPEPGAPASSAPVTTGGSADPRPLLQPVPATRSDDDWLADVEQRLRVAARELRPPVDSGDPSEAETQELLQDGEPPEQMPERRVMLTAVPSAPAAASLEPAAAANVEPFAEQPSAEPASGTTGPAPFRSEETGAGLASMGEAPLSVVDGESLADHVSPAPSAAAIGAVSENTDLTGGRRWSRRSLALAGVGAAAVIAIAVGLPGLSGSKPPGQAVRLRPSGAQSPSAGTAVSPPAAPAAASEAGPTGSAGTQAPAALNVRLRPLRECWVRVTVDGQRDERTLQPGEDIMLRGQGHVVLRVGDAGALAVELNGRALPPLGPDGQVVNKRIDASTAAQLDAKAGEAARGSQ
jgi:hypothetical protein